MNMPQSIYDWVKKEESRFETEEIQVGDNWNWSFRKHVQLIFHLMNGVFYTGSNDWMRAFKNIMEPILNLAYWSEDIEVKDVVFYIESENGRELSFLVKKYHDEVYVKKYNLDTLFDEITESDLDYGGVLLQKQDGKPEVLPLMTVAFCDQTDIMGGPIAFKHTFSPDKLRLMSKNGWGSPSNGATISIEDLITMACYDKTPAGLKQKNNTPGKSIEVYIVHGNLPDSYLNDGGDDDYYYNQIHIIAYYLHQNKKREGVTLYRKKEAEGSLKFHTSKNVYGRALGRGEGEALLHPQIWTNFLTIHKTQMLEAAAKVPLYTDDPSYTQRQRIQDMENLEITTIEDGKRIYQVPTAAPANIQLYEASISEWYEHAQLAGSAFDPLLGKDQPSGQTFRGQERTVAQGKGLHERRRGQRAKFIEEVYRDYIIPRIVRDILKGQKFLASLTSEEMEWISDRLSTNFANKKIVDAALEGKVLSPEEVDTLKQEFKTVFAKDNKKLIEILKGEFEDVEIKMGINIAGKQKDLVNLSDKLLSIFQFVFANPAAFQQAMQIPALARAFEDILEFSGISQTEFTSFVSSQPLALPTAVPTAPVPALTTAQA